MENRWKADEDHRLAVKNAAISSRKVMVSKASGKVIQQPMFSQEYILRVKNAISELVDRRVVSKDGATKKFVEQDTAAGDGTTTPSI